VFLAKINMEIKLDPNSVVLSLLDGPLFSHIFKDFSTFY
jgi:hypothetical protein